MPAPVPPPLLEVLSAARARGWIGPAPLEDQVAHSLRFADCWSAVRDQAPPARAVDLGAGGGLPGLVLATVVWPTTHWTLLDASTARCAHLAAAVTDLGLDSRVAVVHERAEVYGQAARGTADLVTARSFGPPAVTAECALPLCTPGGLVLVSEPPGAHDDRRWPTPGLAALGGAYVTTVAGVAALEAREPAAARYPRRVGIPAKRPLF